MCQAYSKKGFSVSFPWWVSYDADVGVLSLAPGAVASGSPSSGHRVPPRCGIALQKQPPLAFPGERFLQRNVMNHCLNEYENNLSTHLLFCFFSLN